MGRMIYTRLVLDMASGETLEAQGFAYDGPVAECMGGGSGGGSSTTNTVDEAYNARMATLSEEQQGWARDYYNMWQQYQKPYEIAQTQANMEMLPLETELYKQQLTAAKDLLPQQTAAAQKFLTSATSGVDVNERMALATADASSAWKDAQAQTARANARMGVNPNSGRFRALRPHWTRRRPPSLPGPGPRPAWARSRKTLNV